MKVSKKPNDAVRLWRDILYEKYQAKIFYTPTIRNNHHHFTLDEVENENVIIDEDNHDEMKTERTSSQEIQMNKKRGHQKSRSDGSGII
jgi:hypothetical protein